ncbi:unnamed protein product [Ectocarpus sp. 13 AM-2016]
MAKSLVVVCTSEKSAQSSTAFSPHHRPTRSSLSLAPNSQATERGGPPSSKAPFDQFLRTSFRAVTEAPQTRRLCLCARDMEAQQKNFTRHIPWRGGRFSSIFGSPLPTPEETVGGGCTRF